MAAFTSFMQCCAAIVLGVLAAGSIVHGQPAPLTMPAEKTAPALAPAEVPPSNAAVAAPYRCGGIGSDESAAMRVQMKNHPLSLLFAQQGGAYLADIDVQIQGAAGKPGLAFRANGPVCLIDLPAGNYTVQAISGGVMKKQAVTLGSEPRTVDFRF